MPASPVSAVRPTSFPARKAVLTTLAGASLVGAVAGCAPSGAAAAPDSTTSPAACASAPTASAGAAASSAAGASPYRDGTFCADGHYVSPNGPETIGVALTLKSGVVTDVQIIEHPTSANTRLYQKHFASGIKDLVVGKKLDSLNVGVVSGSSLTGQGFNDAVTVIKREAS
ncbi:FMN-binding protein [Sinomonas susongensis]|uniref:FMN-binding protein n=1 Tax=Sinomonas susongensis TaxID=1324851 RepID=UPI001FE9EA3F|nr:FMN-binding protein [Sinomonas susongensis]